MTGPQVVDGYLEVPFTGSSFDQCYIAVGSREPGEWRPAFKAYSRRSARRRVLTVPAAGLVGSVTVWTRINEHETRVGQVRL